MVADLCNFVIQFSLRNNEIDEALINKRREIFAPPFIVFQPHNLSSFRHEIRVFFVFHFVILGDKTR